MPFFSIIIPNYNCADFLPRCIDSVLNQTFGDFEIIVVDNFSDDGSKEILEQYQKNDCRFHFIQENNYGIIAHSRNVGVEAAKGEYICFLDSDDWFSEEKLSYVHNLICQDNCDFVYHEMYAYNSKGKTRIIGRRLTSENKYEELLLKGNIICNSSVCVKTSILTKIGGISEDERLRTAEDADCWLRVAREGYSMLFINIPLGYYWVGDNNCSSNISTLKQREFLYSIHINNIPNDKQRKVLHTLEYIRGLRYFQAGMKRNAIHSFIHSIPQYSFLKSLKAIIMIIRSFFI